jgi:hypothetical protein
MFSCPKDTPYLFYNHFEDKESRVLFTLLASFFPYKKLPSTLTNYLKLLLYWNL